MLSTAQSGSSDILAFGLERELEYRGHITPADHLVPLQRRAYASADTRQIRVWGPDGDIAKYTFPSSRRSMVTAMAYCPTYQAVLTTELDLSLKVYGMERMDLLENYSLEQLRKQGERKVALASAGSAKVTALCYLERHGSVLVGGEGGCELWRLYKSIARRDNGSTAFRLALELVRVVTKEPVSRAIETHARILMWGPRSLLVFDSELEPIVSIPEPHTAHISTACLNLVSNLDTELLSGAEDGTIKSWSVHVKPKLLNAADGGQGEAQASVEYRLQHEFHAHGRPVEMMFWYDRPRKGLRQRLFTSYARDGKVKVWSLEAFTLVYELDLSMLDATATLFPIAPHHFAISTAQETPDGLGQSAMLTVLRFNANVATPFATTNQSLVVSIAQPPLSPGVLRHGQHFSPVAQGEDDAAVLISEDTAVRVVGTAGSPLAANESRAEPDARLGAGARASLDVGGQGSLNPGRGAAHLISTLPPPPNSKVHVLGAFLVPVWQLLVLWLSTKEVAVFFIPTMSTRPSKEGMHDSPTASLSGSKEAFSEASARVRSTTTPLLLRRFGSHEVQAELPDEGLLREAFSSVALHHGPPPEEFDRVLVAGLTGHRSPPPPKDPGEVEPDWFLMVGTDLGTLQAFRLRDILAALPIWERLASHLPLGAWGRHEHGRADAARAQNSRVEERVHLENPVPRPSGQRPFPQDAATVRLHGRWKCHNYTVDVTSAMGDRAFTVDAKRHLKLWRLEDMSLVYSHKLGSYVCHTPFLRQPVLPQELAPSLVLSGLACGKASGHLELVSESGDGPVVLRSSAYHSEGMMEVDHLWPMNAFVSAGNDDSVKIWSRNLGLLKEVLFPQRLTTVAFRRHHGLDQRRGHGDVLVGFAAHVEQIPLEVWSRGITRALGPRQRNVRSVPTNDAQPPTEPGAAHAEKRESRVTPEAPGRTTLRSQAQESELSSGGETAQEVVEARRRRAYFADFRGAPALAHVGALVGQSAVEKAKAPAEPAQEPPAEARGARHRAALDAPDPGDFHAVMKRGVGYFDKAVVPSPAVDARRAETIRGEADEQGVALVTSVGSRYLNVPPPPSAALAAPRARAPDADEPAAGRPPIRHDQRAGPPAPGAAEAQKTRASDDEDEEEMMGLGLLAIGPGRRGIGGAADLAQEFEKLPLLPDGAMSPAHSESESAPLGRRITRRGSAVLTPPCVSTVLTDLGNAGRPSVPAARMGPVIPEEAVRTRANPGAMLLFGQPAGRGPPRPQAGEEGAAGKRRSSMSSRVQLEGRRASALSGGPGGPKVSAPRPRAAPADPGSSSASALSECEASCEVDPRSPRLDAQSPGAPSQGGCSSDEDAAEEEMRSRRAARGLMGAGGRARAPPKAQHVANTPADAARMLEARGAVEEAPELPEENVLKRAVVKRTEWVYLPAGSEELERRRAASVGLQRRQSCGGAGAQEAVWSSAGRMVMHGHLAPTSALPDGIVPRLPLQQPPRAPMTRGEVTEQRLIASARAGPPLSRGSRLESAQHELVRLNRLELAARAPHSARAYTGAAECLQRSRRSGAARGRAAPEAAAPAADDAEAAEADALAAKLAAEPAEASARQAAHSGGKNSASGGDASEPVEPGPTLRNLSTVSVVMAMAVA